MDRNAAKNYEQGGTVNSDGTGKNWRHVDPTGVIERAGLYIICLPQTLGWYYGYLYTGHTLKKKADRWLLILRAEKVGNKWVAFIEGETPVDCVRNMSWLMRSKAITWRPDQY